MNTPQEEAERIARIAGMNHNPDDAVRTTILRETAIAELIAVARAANKKDQHFNSRSTLADGEIHTSLEALRATGKVIL